MSELEQAAGARLIANHMSALMGDAATHGLNPGPLLATAAATIMSFLFDGGMTDEMAQNLVRHAKTVSEAHAANAALLAAIPAGNA